jgi:hypothetical protein
MPWTLRPAYEVFSVGTTDDEDFFLALAWDLELAEEDDDDDGAADAGADEDDEDDDKKGGNAAAEDTPDDAAFISDHASSTF